MSDEMKMAISVRSAQVLCQARLERILCPCYKDGVKRAGAIGRLREHEAELMTQDVERLAWGRLLCDQRFPKNVLDLPRAEADPDWLVNSRTEPERDFDRILFATPTRRLGDETQVFPLEKNESVLYSFDA